MAALSAAIASGEQGTMFDSHSDLAAIVYRDSDDPDAVLRHFAMSLRSRGCRVVGLIQSARRRQACHEPSGVIIHSGRRIGLWRQLGPGAEGCRLDPGQLVDAGRQIAAELANGADLVIISRFGRQESEGHGLCGLILAALEMDIPVVIAVATWRFNEWLRFAEGMSVKLACRPAALQAWWQGTKRDASGPGSASRACLGRVCETLKSY